MAGNKIRRTLHLLRGPLRQSVLLLDPERARGFLDQVRRDLENFRKLDGVKDAFIKKVVRRSTFSGLLGKQLSKVCEEAGFEPTP
eukprot:7355835-Pyramimonas_sp.AAC.1